MTVCLYNTLTRKKEELLPLLPPAVTMYTCGVTVYDDCHLGHARSLYIFEVMRRYLSRRGFNVRFIRNITDIDDKIINRAQETGVASLALAEEFISHYYRDLASLGLSRADEEPRATQNIPEMIIHIRGLINAGHAYERGSDVYFRVRSFKDYGKLSGQSIEAMQSSVRIDPNEKKEDPLDFALWKRAKENEPSWESPWGRGRPGWHIECSAMSMKYLGVPTLDIHAGGRDLVFPHHENEIAQSEALTGKPFAKYWIHHGLLTINGQKMSKSLGNFVTIQDFMSRHRSADLLKFFFLTAHYASPVDYTDRKIVESKHALERIDIFLDRANRAPGTAKAPAGARSAGVDERVKQFHDAMDDDFNTPQALAALFDLITDANKNASDVVFLSAAAAFIRDALQLFVIAGRRTAAGNESDSEIETLIKRRTEARRNKDFALSDSIRKDLEARGIILEDTKEGTIWRRKL